MNPKYSVVIPVYNRPDEVDELLQSLCGQIYQNFEVVVVEDGSAIPCKQVVKKYTEMLDVHYFEKPKSINNLLEDFEKLPLESQRAFAMQIFEKFIKKV